MTLPQQIAAILGPTLVVLTLSELKNFAIWRDVPAPLVHLNGLILFAAGLTILTLNHAFAPWGPALVTLSGALLLVGGTYRMVFPTAPQATPGPLTWLFIGTLCALGLALSAFAYLVT